MLIKYLSGTETVTWLERLDQNNENSEVIAVLGQEHIV